VNACVNVPEPEVIARFWFAARVNPPFADNNPAEVIVPVPVVEILFDVEIELAVAIEPNPEAMEPEVRIPTPVNDDPVTPDANVAPVRVPAAAVIVLVVPYVIAVPLIVVPVVVPVPPLPTANVPANVIAPVVPVDGVSPVVPAEKEVTAPDEVKNEDDNTFSITPVDVFLVIIS
jgi:hypothetical protein